jgi:hypothetical protein
LQRTAGPFIRVKRRHSEIGAGCPVYPPRRMSGICEHTALCGPGHRTDRTPHKRGVLSVRFVRRGRGLLDTSGQIGRHGSVRMTQKWPLMRFVLMSLVRRPPPLKTNPESLLSHREASKGFRSSMCAHAREAEVRCPGGCLAILHDAPSTRVATGSVAVLALRPACPGRSGRPMKSYSASASWFMQVPRSMQALSSGKIGYAR